MQTTSNDLRLTFCLCRPIRSRFTMLKNFWFSKVDVRRYVVIVTITCQQLCVVAAFLNWLSVLTNTLKTLSIWNHQEGACQVSCLVWTWVFQGYRSSRSSDCNLVSLPRPHEVRSALSELEQLLRVVFRKVQTTAEEMVGKTKPLPYQYHSRSF